MSEQPHPEPMVALPASDRVLDAGLAAAFGPDSEPPIPAGASVLKALGAALPDMPRVQLRESGKRSKGVGKGAGVPLEGEGLLPGLCVPHLHLPWLAQGPRGAGE